MKLKNVLVLYKRSAYRIYFLEPQSSLRLQKKSIIEKEIKRFQQSHEDHYNTLRTVAKVLRAFGIRFAENYRGHGVDYPQFDFIITVGGDGTFLEASRRIKNQLILGVNSAPNHSVGRFCVANAKNFESILKKILSNNFKVKHFHRLRLVFEGQKIPPVLALNDALICHRNPAMLCRYYLKINNRKEEQRSSGIWVASAAGSSGAIHSAGGKIVNPYDGHIQYKPRELYQGKHDKYALTGGLLKGNQIISVTSLMRQGMVYVDGAHVHYPFKYGATLKVSLSKHPIRTISA